MNFLKKAFWFVLPVLVVAIFFLNLSDSGKSNKTSDLGFSLKLNRFDSTFFNIKPENLEDKLPALREEYPAFFMGTSDQFWVNQKQDELQKKLYVEVKRELDFNVIERDIESLLQHYYGFYPNRPRFELTTYISNLDFYNPILIQDSLQQIFLASDDYLGPKHPAYAQIDEYLAFYRDKRFIQSEVAENLAMAAAKVDNEDLSLLNQMIWWGKIMYAKKQWMPEAEEYMIMRYSKDKWQFCQETELDIWVYFVKENLLFDTKEDTKRRFIYLSPFSKFYTEFDSKSPGMIGQWVGLKIIESYMKNNDISLQELMRNTDHKAIFNTSKYRP